MKFDYDLFVIGAGSGGIRAARMAAIGGARVALAEQDRYGGTCVIRGCVPKKLMAFAAEFSAHLRDAQDYGWQLTAGPLDWSKFRTGLQAELARLEQVHRELLRASGVRSFDARARLLDAHTVELSDGSRHRARHILVATGGRPRLPSIPGVELGISSNAVFHLDALPARMLIVGGGYIACEFASILQGLGVQVSLYHRGSHLLRGFDEEISECITEALRHAGVELRADTELASLSRTGAAIEVHTSAGERHLFEQVLFATGRMPNTEDMGLAEVGVQLGRGGEVHVDAFSQTAVPSIHAIGDVTDRLNLTPVAIRDAMAFVATVFAGTPTRVDHAQVPTAVFTRPEIGSVGLSEQSARESGPIEVYCNTFRPMRSAFIGRSTRALMKLVVCARSRRVLGCHIVAPGAAEMIQLAAIAVKMGATKEDFDRTVAVHPTLAEELVTMRTPTRRD